MWFDDLYTHVPFKTSFYWTRWRKTAHEDPPALGKTLFRVRATKTDGQRKDKIRRFEQPIIMIPKTKISSWVLHTTCAWREENIGVLCDEFRHNHKTQEHNTNHPLLFECLQELGQKLLPRKIKIKLFQPTINLCKNIAHLLPRHSINLHVCVTSGAISNWTIQNNLPNRILKELKYSISHPLPPHPSPVMGIECKRAAKIENDPSPPTSRQVGMGEAFHDCWPDKKCNF